MGSFLYDVHLNLLACIEFVAVVACPGGAQVQRQGGGDQARAGRLLTPDTGVGGKGGVGADILNTGKNTQTYFQVDKSYPKKFVN